MEALQAGLNPSMSPFPLRGTWTGKASIHQFPLPIPPSLFLSLSQSFYFTPPSTFTLKFEPITQPPFVLLVGSSVFQNSPLFLPISLLRSLPFYPSVLLGIELRIGPSSGVYRKCLYLARPMFLLLKMVQAK